MKTKLRILKMVMMTATMVSIVAVSCILFQNCQKTETDIDYSLDIPDDYNEVGKIHNEGLDYTLAEIQNTYIQITSSNLRDPISKLSIDYSTIAKKAMIDFFRSNPRTMGSFYLYESSFLKNGYVQKPVNVSELKPKQKELMDEIQLALKAEIKSKNLKRLKEKLDKINKDALSNLPEIEAAPIYCATSTAYSTFQYWNKNYRAWYFVLHYPELLDQYDKAELNRLRLKNTSISLDTIPWNQETPKKAWDYLEGWFVSFADAVDLWWDEYGEKILISDCVGAVFGGVEALATAGAGSLVFGPQGLVVVGVAGAIIGSVETSVEAAIVTGIIEVGKE